MNGKVEKGRREMKNGNEIEHVRKCDQRVNMEMCFLKVIGPVVL